MSFKIKSIMLAFVTTVLMTSTVSAQDTGTFLPEPLQNLLNLMGEDGSGTGEFATSRIRNLIVLGLGIILLTAVIYSLFAAFKYVRSQGDPGQIEEAEKAIKSIIMGLGILFLSLIGLILIFVFFGTGFISSQIYQTCLSAPNSPGCIACQADDGGVPDDWDTIKFLPNFFAVIAAANGGAGTRTANEQACTTCEWEYFALSRGVGTGVLPMCKE